MTEALNESDFSALAVQGKVTGVIIPPPDIRAVVDKTATFVARNGKSFEQKILNSAEGKTAKFNFMRPFDPYHAYYEQKIREVEEGKEISTDSTKSAAIAILKNENNNVINNSQTISTTSMKATFINPLAKLTQNKSVEQPPELEFSLGHPNGLSSLDFDIIKQTAQYTAINGRDFLGGLAQREQRNPQFDFLKPTHMLFNYFTSLVDNYTKILRPSDNHRLLLERRNNRNSVLQMGIQRWEWKKQEEEKKKSKEVDKDGVEKATIQTIDWYDFTVVEVIDFPENDLIYEPPKPTVPTTNVQNFAPFSAPSMTSNYNNTTTTTKPLNDPISLPAVKPSNMEDMDVDMIDDDDETEIKVVNSYVPRTSQTINANNSMLLIDPISKKAIPTNQMEEHMRIQLLDPKWREEQKKFQEKQKETSYTTGASISENLKLLAHKRNDIFGTEASDRNESSKDNDFGKESEEKDNENFDEKVVDFKRKDATIVPPPAPQIPAPPVVQIKPPPIIPIFPPAPPILPVVAPVVPIVPVPVVPLMPVPVTVPVPMPVPLPPVLPSNTVITNSVPPPPIPFNAPYFPLPPTDNKKPERDFMPADQFASKFPDPIPVHVVTTIDATTPANWGLDGRTITIIVPITTLVKDIKENLTKQLDGMPSNKMQLKSLSLGIFLKDSQSLAEINFLPGSKLELTARSRGGKK